MYRGIGEQADAKYKTDSEVIDFAVRFTAWAGNVILEFFLFE